MSASTRLSIAWPPDFPPEEKTDTLVLSFPSKHFIDLRFMKDETTPSLDWGFAGIMETEDHWTTFIHLLDSGNPHDPQSIHDSGEFELLSNGDERETGSMVNPTVGRVMLYEEIWRKLPQSTQRGAVCLVSATDEPVKAYIGRVGKWFQGICLCDGRISAVRRVLDEGIWKEVYRVGDETVSLPTLDTSHQTSWQAGQLVECGGRHWTVLDVEQ